MLCHTSMGFILCDEGDWEQAVHKFKEMLDYVIEKDEAGIQEADELLQKKEPEKAFNRLTESVRYADT
ncbi:hypothetical protein [Thermoflavimicrobium dichotomicum]|uniref:hypothetical protein n=1 Tax=Thermoflavimicrobium dichotomicum TaxID=46223 RepID=UPI0011137583|nr:hypothetical protein [Thermoflavimicrobium dichotomicum]